MKRRVQPNRFVDRCSAGRKLTERLVPETSRSGGRTGEWAIRWCSAWSEAAYRVARQIGLALDVPLDVAVARKIGTPARPGLGVGAVTAGAPPIFDRRSLAVLNLTPATLAETRARKRADATRRASTAVGGATRPVVSDLRRVQPYAGTGRSATTGV